MNLIVAFQLCLNSLGKGLNGHLNPDFCKAGAVLYQLSYQANWELVVMWVDYKPIHVDVEIDDEDTRIFPVFEMRIRMNEFDDGISALLIKQQREKKEFDP